MMKASTTRKSQKQSLSQIFNGDNLAGLRHQASRYDDSWRHYVVTKERQRQIDALCQPFKQQSKGKIKLVRLQAPR